MTRSTSNSTPSRYSSSSRSLPARKITSFSGVDDAAHERVDLRQRLEVVDPDAADGARTELGLDDRGEADDGLPRRTARRATGRAGPRGVGSPSSADSSRVRTLLRAASTASGGLPGRPSAAATRAATATLSSQKVKNAVGSDAGVRERVEHGTRVLIGVADDRRGEP